MAMTMATSVTPSFCGAPKQRHQQQQRQAVAVAFDCAGNSRHCGSGASARSKSSGRGQGQRVAGRGKASVGGAAASGASALRLRSAAIIGESPSSGAASSVQPALGRAAGRTSCRVRSSADGGGTTQTGGDPNTSPPPPSSTSTSPTQALEGVTVLRTDGQTVAVLELWSKRRAVVAWVRHFGCLLCRRRAAALAQLKDDMDAAGVALVVIGPGSVEQASAFLEQTSFPGEVYTDPERASFEALEFAYGASTIFTPKAALNLIQARLQGFEQDWKLSLQRDTVLRGGWQQGGVLVAGPGPDNVQFLHKDAEAGDEPDLDAIRVACCDLATA